MKPNLGLHFLLSSSVSLFQVLLSSSSHQIDWGLPKVTPATAPQAEKVILYKPWACMIMPTVCVCVYACVLPSIIIKCNGSVAVLLHHMRDQRTWCSHYVSQLSPCSRWCWGSFCMVIKLNECFTPQIMAFRSLNEHHCSLKWPVMSVGRARLHHMLFFFFSFDFIFY